MKCLFAFCKRSKPAVHAHELFYWTTYVGKGCIWDRVEGPEDILVKVVTQEWY